MYPSLSLPRKMVTVGKYWATFTESFTRAADVGAGRGGHPMGSPARREGSLPHTKGRTSGIDK